MTADVELLLDSVCPTGARVTTWKLTYPRFVHAELLTHGVFAKNAASSRAIPAARMRQNIMESPAEIVWWGKNQKGMQAQEQLDGQALVDVQDRWERAMNDALNHHRALEQLGLHKQIANRIVEPWMKITIILTTTHLLNWFMLRNHPDAQPEIRDVAAQMHEAFKQSTRDKRYRLLRPGEWHRPYWTPEDEAQMHSLDTSVLGDIKMDLWPIMVHLNVDWLDEGDLNEEHKRWLYTDLVRSAVAIGRMARVSYLTHDGKRDMQEDLRLFSQLIMSRPMHLSPCEHVAMAVSRESWLPIAGRDAREWIDDGRHTGRLWGVVSLRRLLDGEQGPPEPNWRFLYDSDNANNADNANNVDESKE